MSIESVDYDGPVSLLCDGDKCSTYLEFGSFSKAVAFKKKQKEKPSGWRSSKVDGEWKDLCPQCVAKFSNGN